MAGGEYRFVGGPHDGRTLFVVPEAREVVLPNPMEPVGLLSREAPPLSDSVSTSHYRMEKWIHATGRVERVYVHEGVPTGKLRACSAWCCDKEVEALAFAIFATEPRFLSGWRPPGEEFVAEVEWEAAKRALLAEPYFRRAVAVRTVERARLK